MHFSQSVQFCDYVYALQLFDFDLVLFISVCLPHLLVMVLRSFQGNKGYNPSVHPLFLYCHLAPYSYIAFKVPRLFKDCCCNYPWKVSGFKASIHCLQTICLKNIEKDNLVFGHLKTQHFLMSILTKRFWKKGFHH